MTRKLCYRKDDRAMRSILCVSLMSLHGVGLESSSTGSGLLCKIFSFPKIFPRSPGIRWMAFVYVFG